jgi:uncharacterized phiE125 gp8 family phage protein
MRLKRTTDPASNPVTLAEAKLYARIDCTDEDDLITTLIQVATDYIERYLNRQLITATYVGSLDSFPSETLKLPKPPFLSVVSLTYINSSGARTGVSTSVYETNENGMYGELYLARNQSWPTDAECRENSIEVTFTAGYGSSADDVPDPIKHAIKMLILDMYERREAQVDRALVDNPVFKNLLYSYKAVEVN